MLTSKMMKMDGGVPLIGTKTSVFVEEKDDEVLGYFGQET